MKTKHVNKAQIAISAAKSEEQAHTPNLQLLPEIRASNSIQLHQHDKDQQQQANVNMGTNGAEDQTSNIELVPEIRDPGNNQVHHQ